MTSEPVAMLNKLPKDFGDESRYAVIVGGVEVGSVRSARHLVYRGSQGWNRGIRLRDFHPLTWEYMRAGEHQWRHGGYTRKQAIGRLMETP